MRVGRLDRQRARLCDQHLGRDAILGMCSSLFCLFGRRLMDAAPFRQAWSDIVSTLNPHVAALSTYLTRFAGICAASEVVLFERTTMLVISQSLLAPPGPSSTSSSSEAQQSVASWPEDRFAKISQAIKLFRLGCKCVYSSFCCRGIG